MCLKNLYFEHKIIRILLLLLLFMCQAYLVKVLKQQHTTPMIFKRGARSDPNGVLLLF